MDAAGPGPSSAAGGGAAPSGGGANGTRKLVIKAFKDKPKLPEDFEAVTWAKLRAALAAIHAKQPVSASFEELYRCCEDLCLHKFAPSLYANVAAELDAYAAAFVARLASPHAHGDGQPAPAAAAAAAAAGGGGGGGTGGHDDVASGSGSYLARVDAAWQDHCACALTLRSVCTVLDRSYALATPGVAPLWEASLAAVRAHLADAPQVVTRTVGGLLALLHAERSGEGVDRRLVRDLLRMLSALGLYASAFEPRFLRDTEAFYAAEAAQLVASLDVAAYLRHAETRLQEEAERASTCLDASTRKALLSCCEAALVGCHVSVVLDKGFVPLMASCTERMHDLGRLYALLSRVGATDALRVALGAYVRAAGTAIVKDEAQEEALVPRLLDLKAALDSTHRGAFAGNEAFGHTVKDAFEKCVNSRANKPAEMVAKHLDGVLKAGNKAQSEEELEQTLDKVLMLFRFLTGKDVFEAFYKKDLAKRLLLHKSASVDAEKSMLAKLKAECGPQFTAKMEGMFRDVDLSRDVTTAFRDACPAVSGVETAVNVLTAGFWPSYPPDDVALPLELAALQTQFTDFYLSKHGGRKLSWRHVLGSCVLRARFASCGQRELAVSVYQTAVLMLFNDVDPAGGRLSFSDIKAATRLEDGELRRTLQSLACGKVRILVKEPKGKDIGDDDSFVVNDSLQEPRFRIKVNTVQLKETPQEAAAVNEKVQQDRQYQVDAAIVRIMKTRKQLAHGQLLDELVRQLRFECRREDLKKRIESLIDREYLERDPKDASVYKYLA